jgi:hypothetical protein
MSLNHTSVTLDLDLPALLALQGGLIPVLSQKQPHFISGASVSSAGTQDGKLNHPARVIPKPLYGENVVSFQLTG